MRSGSAVISRLNAMEMLLDAVRRHWVLVTLAVLISITMLSLWPLQALPDIPGSDKSHHVIAYAALMFPVALRRPRYWIVIGLLFILYSGLIELIQPTVNRYGEWLDLAANSAGVVCGWIIAVLMDIFFPGAARNSR